MDIIYKIRFFRIFREIRIYFEYLNQIRLESVNSPKWSKLKLRKDWIGRIYTVINLPPEVTQSPDFPKEARPAFVMEESRAINEYLTEINLQELLTVGFKPIEENGGDSYLVIYYYLFRELTWMWILTRSLFWTGAIYAYLYFV